MMKWSKIFAFLLVGFGPVSHADTLLLVHGYLGDGSSWEHNGISQMLDANGWKHAGRFVGTPGGPQLLVTGQPDEGKRTYIANLPSTAPMMLQSNLLLDMINQLEQRHPGEDIILVGHSAGGIVARTSLARNPEAKVSKLITIASPHVGTWRAGQALNITDNHGPFNMVKSFFGGSGYDALKHSRALLHDLLYPRPGSLLYWLNAQPHPDIEYISVIRTRPDGFAGDNIVPGFSQDMNNVPVLQGKSRVIATPAAHYLTPMDADLLLAELNTG